MRLAALVDVLYVMYFRLLLLLLYVIRERSPNRDPQIPNLVLGCADGDVLGVCALGLSQQERIQEPQPERPRQASRKPSS